MALAVYALDPDHTFVHFEVQHFGTSTVRGRFGPVTGEVTLDRALGRGELGLRINTASVDTASRASTPACVRLTCWPAPSTPKPSSWHATSALTATV